MELIYIRASPWSAYLVWAIYYSGVSSTSRIKQWTEHFPFAGELRLRWKAGTLFPSEPLTVPMLVNEQGAAMKITSVDIAQILCSAAVFPQEKAKEIEVWFDKCNTVLRYGRSLAWVCEDDVLSKLMPNIPLVTSLVGFLSSATLKSKYKEGDESVSLQEAIVILREIAMVVNKEEMVFVLGTPTPTVADFACAIVIETLEPRNNVVIQSFAPNACAYLKEKIIDPNEKELAPLFKWKQRMFQNFFQGQQYSELHERIELPRPIS